MRNSAPTTRSKEALASFEHPPRSGADSASRGRLSQVDSLTYFRLALFLPIVIPLVGWMAVYFLAGARGDVTVQKLLGLGLPYLAFALFVLRRSKRKPTVGYAQRILWRAPAIISIVVSIVSATIATFVVPDGDWRLFLFGVAMVLTAGLVIGYSFAIVIYLGYRVLRYAGVVVDR